MKNDVILRMDLRGLRKEAGLEIEEVAKKSGISAASIERLEQKEAPSLSNALKLARLLHVDVEDIWGLEEKEKEKES